MKCLICKQAFTQSGTTTIEKLKVLQMYLNDLLKSRREEILQIAAKHGAHNVSIFG